MNISLAVMGVLLDDAIARDRTITSIVLTLGEQLDHPYIEFWVDKKGLTSLWGELLAKIRSRK